MTGASTSLRERHATMLDAFVHHRFFLAAETGELTAGARDGYFTSERQFVGAARNVFAHILLKAPHLGSARHIVGILDGLVNEQEALFDEIYSVLGLADTAVPGPATRALAEGMTQIAREGPYVAGLCAMLAAEWTYAEVARRGTWSRADPTMRDWMRLHAAERFLSGVTWLEREIDATWTVRDAGAADAAFIRAIELEVDFHDEPLRGAAAG